MVYNGEVYNYLELRAELEKLGEVFLTQTDTEVFLRAYIKWGSSCFKKIVGMFAAVIYDQQLETVTMVRDAFGIKPLFYILNDDYFVFSSEITPLTLLLGNNLRPNYQVIMDYLIHGAYDHGTETFYSEIFSLPPASILTTCIKTNDSAVAKEWWVPEITSKFTGTFAEASKRLKLIFRKSLELHLRSDVPVGVMLSGGIDSSSILCGMKLTEFDKDVSSFSYVAEDKSVSEEYWIDLVTKDTNIKNYKISSSPNSLLNDLEALVSAQGEPFGTPSIYAQYLVYRLAKGHGVKVLLDGQGADELLGGYDGHPGERFISFFETFRILSAFSFLSKWAVRHEKPLFTPILMAVKTLAPQKLLVLLRSLTGRPSIPRWLNREKIKSLGITKLRRSEPRFTVGFAEYGNRLKGKLRWSLRNRTLPSLLRHGDRNSMIHSIEARVPFLTIELAEFMYSLPEEFLVSDNGETKHIFRDAMKGILPDELIARTDKVGFDPGSAQWKDKYILAIKAMNLTCDEALIIQLEKLEKLSEHQLWRILNYLIWSEASFANVKR